MLHYAGVPDIDIAEFRLKTWGLVDRPLELSFDDIRALPKVTLTADFHCVTTWSRLNNLWEGVSFRTIAEMTGLKKTARYVMVHGYDGYYTNAPLATLLDERVLLAWSLDGETLSPEHGGPLRLVVPQLYAWKSAKWVSGFEFMDQDRRGFWEQRGYHNRADPWNEERYSYQESGDETE